LSDNLKIQRKICPKSQMVWMNWFQSYKKTKNLIRYWIKTLIILKTHLL